MGSEQGEISPLQTGREFEEGRPELSATESEVAYSASAALEAALPIPFDLRGLNEMLPEKARKLETNGSFYAGTLEREWVYRKLCELGFLTGEVKNRIEARQRALQEGREVFSFEKVFQECAPEDQKYIERLSRAFFLTEAGVLSKEELSEFEECLRSGEDGVAFLAQKQKAAEDLFLQAFPDFSSCAPSQIEKLTFLHFDFQRLFSHQSVTNKRAEKRYLCTSMGIVMLGGERVPLLPLTEVVGFDSKLGALSTIQRAYVLDAISQRQADSLIAGIHLP